MNANNFNKFTTDDPPCVQLLAVFMQLDTRSLLMNYIDLRQTNNVQLTFDALLVRMMASL